MEDQRVTLLPVRVVGGVTVAAARGRLDHLTAGALGAALAPLLAGCKAGSPALLLDLSAVDYMSSLGLRTLVVAFRQAAAQGGRFAVAGMQPLVAEIFAIARLNLVMPCYVDVDGACAQLA